MSEHRERLIQTIAEGLGQLSTPELDLFTMAVLHGVPVMKLAGEPQANVDLLIGAQKKLRRFMTEQGFGTADLEKGKKRG